MLHGEPGASRPDLSAPPGRFPKPPPPPHLTEADAAERVVCHAPKDQVAILAAMGAQLRADWGRPGRELASRNALLVALAAALALLHAGPRVVGGTNARGGA